MTTTILSKKDPGAFERRRLQAIEWLKLNRPQAEVAAKLQVSRQAVHHWWKLYQQAGSKGLKATKSQGRPGKMTFAELKTKLPALLRKGAMAFGYAANVWTTANIGTVIQKEMGVRYHRDHMRKILHKMGYSWQKPEKRAVERNERRIRYWVNTTWPDIKKKP
jgi:transposase